MNKLVVSAPFGNYYGLIKLLTGATFTPTLGTFTLKPRTFLHKPYGGRFARTLLTVRYDFRSQSWRNRIGLKNPGVDSVKDAQDKIISVYGTTPHEWESLVQK